jgi:hypothetical protein
MNRVGRAVFLFSAMLLAACGQTQPLRPTEPLIASEPAPEVLAPDPNDWNIFPDPITGRVEVYRDGAHVGSVTGEEREEPPIPRKRESAGTE